MNRNSELKLFTRPHPLRHRYTDTAHWLICENRQIAFLSGSTGPSDVNPAAPLVRAQEHQPVLGWARMHPGLPRACPRRREGLLTCGGRREAPRAAGRRLGLRVAAGAVRGLRRPFLSAPGGGGLGAFTGHGRWGRGRAGSKSGRGPVPVRFPHPGPAVRRAQPPPRPTRGKLRAPVFESPVVKPRSTPAGPRERRHKKLKCQEGGIRFLKS